MQKSLPTIYLFYNFFFSLNNICEEKLMEVVGCKSGVRTGSSHMATTLNQSSLNILHTLVVYRGQLSIHVCRIITNFEDPMSNKNIP
jgi:hypothetical protein